MRPPPPTDPFSHPPPLNTQSNPSFFPIPQSIRIRTRTARRCTGSSEPRPRSPSAPRPAASPRRRPRPPRPPRGERLWWMCVFGCMYVCVCACVSGDGVGKRWVMVVALEREREDKGTHGGAWAACWRGEPLFLCVCTCLDCLGWTRARKGERKGKEERRRSYRPTDRPTDHQSRANGLIKMAQDKTPRHKLKQK